MDSLILFHRLTTFLPQTDQTSERIVKSMPLMISISGIRGIVGENLTPDVVVRYASAFGEYCKRACPENPEVVIGRDGRTSGKLIGNIVSSTLLSCGVNVRALGVCPTPTVQLAVELEHAAGGISITASHNPVQWNGLKFLASTGMFLNEAENRELWKIADTNAFSFASWDSLGRHVADDTWVRRHIDLVLSLKYITPDTIRRRKFKVVVDCINASGGLIVPTLLRELGCNVAEMNTDVTGIFAHVPEPIPENLVDLARRVKAEHADLGIAVDPDGDRLVLITEKGEPYGEEYTITSAAKFVLEKEKKGQTIVINLSTTRAVEDIAHACGAKVIRTPVGEINVAQRMKETGAVIGGEGSGGVILPALHLGRDAMVGIPLILQLLAESGKTLSELKSLLPLYSIEKGKVPLPGTSPDTLLEKLRSSVEPGGKINMDDGLRIDFPEYWVHLRRSNTEPIVRIIAEARTPSAASAAVEQWRQRILSFA